MQIERIEIADIQAKIAREQAGAVIAAPLARFSLQNEGCGLAGCHCSDGYWLTISDGRTLLKVTLSKEEADGIRDGSVYEILT